MSKHVCAIESLSVEAVSALAELGADLRTARKHRNQPLRAWATHLQISVPTLVRMEKGDPTVGMGAYVAALLSIGRLHALASLANVHEEHGANAMVVQRTNERRSNAVQTSPAKDSHPKTDRPRPLSPSHQQDRELAEALHVHSLSGQAYSSWLHASWGRLQEQGNLILASVPEAPQKRTTHFTTMAEKNTCDAELETARAMQISIAHHLAGAAR